MTSKIELLLSELENYIPFYNIYNPNISTSNIGWHLEHSLLTFDRIIDRLSQTKANEYKWTPNIPRFFVFITKTIPRGRAESPESVRPSGDINPGTLIQHLEFTRQKTKELMLLKKDQFFEHPYFGQLNLKQTIKFLEIHTRHHLKIIKDIKT